MYMYLDRLNNTNMAGKPKSTQQMRVYTDDVDRIKKFGLFGESMADALSRALDLAEGKEKAAKKGRAKG